jgi:hypothetical protein
MIPRIVSFSNRVAGKAALIAGAAWAADGVLQLVHPQTKSGSLVVGAAGYTNLTLFMVALFLVTPALVALGEKPNTRLAHLAGLTAASGTFILAITCISSLIHGRDYSIFNIVAPLTNLAWLAGSIIIAVALKRTHTNPSLLAYGLPIAWIATIPLATHGGGLITGAYWMTTALLLLQPERATATPAPAHP